jgi:DNA repair exonuclease SbcCD ATPase subunit
MANTYPKETTMNEHIERAPDVQKAAAQALASNQPLTVAEFKALAHDVEVCRDAVHNHVALIRPRVGDRLAGDIRMRVLATGTKKELDTLDEEFARLDVLRQQLAAQKAALAERSLAAELSEIQANLPKMFRELEEKTKAAAELNDRLSRTLTEVQAAYSEIALARGKCNRYLETAPAADPELARAILELSRNLTRNPFPGLLEREVSDLERTLGLRSLDHLGPQFAPDYEGKAA